MPLAVRDVFVVLGDGITTDGRRECGVGAACDCGRVVNGGGGASSLPLRGDDDDGGPPWRRVLVDDRVSVDDIRGGERVQSQARRRVRRETWYVAIC